MDQVSELIYLKSVKRKGKFLYNFCHTLYEGKLARSTSDKRETFYEALTALDSMYSMYETLKTGMRKHSYSEQIIFAEKWNTYISCIEALTAYQTNDDRLFDGVTLDETAARQTARDIFREFNQQAEVKRTNFLN